MEICRFAILHIRSKHQSFFQSRRLDLGERDINGTWRIISIVICYHLAYPFLLESLRQARHTFQILLEFYWYNFPSIYFIRVAIIWPSWSSCLWRPNCLDPGKGCSQFRHRLQPISPIHWNPPSSHTPTRPFWLKLSPPVLFLRHMEYLFCLSHSGVLPYSRGQDVFLQFPKT